MNKDTINIFTCFWYSIYNKSQVGLALVVDNEIVLGVMGCPNWPGDSSDGTTGTLMLSHIGCGTWTKSLQVTCDWTRRFVDACGLVNKARFCIQDSQPWESLPLSGLFDKKIDSGDLHGNEIRLLPTCCGRYPSIHSLSLSLSLFFLLMSEFIRINNFFYKMTGFWMFWKCSSKTVRQQIFDKLSTCMQGT